jgi:hypothetical protein
MLLREQPMWYAQHSRSLKDEYHETEPVRPARNRLFVMHGLTGEEVDDDRPEGIETLRTVVGRMMGSARPVWTV